MVDLINMALNWAFESGWNAFIFYLIGAGLAYFLIILTSENSAEVANKVYLIILSWFSAFIILSLLVIAVVLGLLTELSKKIYNESKN